MKESEEAAERQIQALRDQLQVAKEAAQKELESAYSQISTQDEQIQELLTKLKTTEEGGEQLAQKLQDQLQAALNRNEILQINLEQEEQRFQNEAEQMKLAHQTALEDVSHRLGEQIGKLNEQIKNEKTALQTQMLKLNSQNQEYRSMLLQNATQLRQLLSRLPAESGSDTVSGSIVAEDNV